VIDAASGEEGIALFAARAAEVRAVLLDMTMPGMSGDEVLVELRRLRAEVPVVIISGHSETDVRQKLEGERAVAFLPKPFTGPELERTLADAIGE